jgi:hypothetical protein
VAVFSDLSRLHRSDCYIRILLRKACPFELSRCADRDADQCAKLNALGIKPARGKGDVTANTVRRWGEKIDETRPLRSVSQLELSAKDRGWITADINARLMLTEEERVKLAALADADARRFILDSLEASVRVMALADPLKPPLRRAASAP